jgi:hypothetical protein
VKRTALKRSAPLRRTSAIRARSTSSYRRRERDFDYMGWIKTQSCAAATVGGVGDCQGPIEADHAGRRGLSRKAPDDTCIPLCQLHHRQRTDHSGLFRTWTRERMRDWLDLEIEHHRSMYAALPGVCW